MQPEPDRSRARVLAKESHDAGDPVGWFERLYQESQQGTTTIPWADMCANPNLLAWREATNLALDGVSALVVGCGLGDDAEQLAQWGMRVTAFDVAPSAVAQARHRFPASAVEYRAADLLNPPAEWAQRFEFVFESYTLQTLPADIRPTAIRKLGQFIAPKGHLLLIARARDSHEPAGEMPWPLTKEELEPIGLTPITWEDYMDGATRRLRILYGRL